MSALLEVQGLTAGYRRPVIRGVSFVLRPGEIAAVLGAPQSTVSIRLRRAREALKKRLEGGPNEDL